MSANLDMCAGEERRDGDGDGGMGRGEGGGGREGQRGMNGRRRIFQWPLGSTVYTCIHNNNTTNNNMKYRKYITYITNFP